MENNNNQSHQLLHSYCLNPEVRFESQGLNEHVLLVLRAHPITQIPWIFNTLVLFILIIVLNVFLFSLLSGRQILFTNIFGFAVLLSYIWFNFLNWFFNVGVVTTLRIIDVDFTSVIYKEVTETRLDRVEDITSKSGGYFESFFDYGNVFVQTAGKDTYIEYMNVPKPSEAVRIIDELIGR